MSSPLPVITGVGLVTPLGRSADATWDALVAGRHITGHTRLERARHPNLPRVTSLAIEAATEAVRHARWPAGTPAGLVACTSKGPIEEWMQSPAATSDNLGRGVDVLNAGWGMGSLLPAVAEQLGVGDGPRLTISSACAGGLQAIARAALLIRAGEADRVLVVAAEASAHPLFIASFDRLGVLPPAGELCRPFDLDRRGFLMSEAAAAVCLESPTRLRTSGPTIAVDQCRFGADATHLTGFDRSGSVLARLIAAANAGPYDLVHTHGTGTELNDAAELTALAKTLPAGGAGATLYSHKAALGHSLGASGLVSVVLSRLAHARGQVPPNVNTHRPMATAMRLSAEPVSTPIRRSLTCAAGFGGGVAVTTLHTL